MVLLRHALARKKETLASKQKPSAEKTQKTKTPSKSIGIEDLKKFSDLYKSFSPASAAIKIRVNESFARGYEITGPNEDLDNFLKDFADRADLTEHMYQAYKDTEMFGNGWTEKGFDKQGKITELFKAHPEIMDLKRDGSGNVEYDAQGKPLGYTQQVSSTEFVDIPLDNMMHFTFDTIGDEILGISLLQAPFVPSLQTMNIQQSTADSAIRHGSPLYHVMIGDEYNPAGPDEIENTGEQLQDLNSKSEIITPHHYKINILESKITEAQQSQTDMFMNQVIAGVQIPKPILLGVGEDSNKAIVQVQSKHFYSTIANNQRILGRSIREQLFKPLALQEGFTDMKEVSHIQWNELLIPGQDEIAATAIDLFESGLIDKEEAREMIGMVSERTQ